MRQNSPAFQIHRLTLVVVFLLTIFSSGQALATIPAGYYDTVDPTTQAALRNSLHEVIDDHTRVSYTSSSLDTWDVLENADQDPNDPGRILDVYLNASYQKWTTGNTDYNREHSWPKSFGFPNDGSSNYPYTDCHQLFLCNDSRNSSRSNKPYGNVGGSGTAEYPTEVNDGVGGGSGVYPGWSNWANTTYWETWIDRRGDVARAQLYMDVRYEGGNHGVTGAWEPDLILTDNLSLIQASNTGNNEPVAYMGLLSVLLQWHAEDPVDAKEIARNDAIYAGQGNRNPFVDHPEWVDCLFTGICSGGSDTTPPSAPMGLIATAGDGSVDLDWDNNLEADLAGYDVYRSTAQGGPYNLVNVGLVALSQYTDIGLVNDTAYYYVVTASDFATNESTASGEASATPMLGIGTSGTVVWINEIHYDNESTDTGEFFEIAGPAGQSLVGWSIAGYSGNGGTLYNTINLSGALPDQQDGYGTLSFNMLGMQNGVADGLALIDDSGSVIEFISYEGVLTATDGPAAGVTSVDIGVSEPAVPVGFSLQLAGTGWLSGDFTWQTAMAHTAGLPNTGQTFQGPVANQLPTAAANGTYNGLMTVSLAFSSAGSSDPDGTITGWLWDFGDGNTSIDANPSHTYLSAATFVVTLTVTDDLGGENADTTSAIIVDPTPAPDTPSILPGAHIASIYPNPFNPTTNIQFSVGEPGRVQVEIYSIKGERVRVLLNEDRSVGDFTLRWNGTNDSGQTVPSGAYFCRVRNHAGTDVQPLMLLK